MKNRGATWHFEALDVEDTKFLRQALWHMVYTEDGHLAPVEVLENPKVNRYISAWDRYPGSGFVAIDKATGEKIGAIWIRYFDEEQAGYGFVKSGIPEICVAVFPEHRGKGVGTELMKKMIKSLPKTTESVSLSVNKTNSAVRLYQRLGFEVVKENHEDWVMMLNSAGLRDVKRRDQRHQKIGLAVVAFLLIATFGLGPFDLNLYTLKTNNSMAAGWSNTHKETDYKVRFIRNNQVVWTQDIMTPKGHPMKVDIKIEPSLYKGNWATPFYKHFTVRSVANVGQTEVSPDGVLTLLPSSSISAHIESDMDIEITGLCSIRKAKEIAEKESLMQIVNSVTTNLQTPN